MLRRKSFWLGLPCLVFLGWLWAMSFHWGYNFTWRGPGGRGVFVRTDRPAALEMGWRQDAGWRVPMGRAFQTWEMAPGNQEDAEIANSPCFPLPRSTSVMPLGSHGFLAPHWLLIAVYSAGWLGVAAWRWGGRSHART
ncbi:MAG: hypothetical protein JWO82_4418 [Akkermansiaceae bacterium]|nr:hypothetical protein [Akkermansiaceae bacterium]